MGLGFYQDFRWGAIQHRESGNVRYRGSRCITTLNCCHRAGCFCNYDLYGEPSIRVGFFRKNHDRIFRKPMEVPLALGFDNLIFSYGSLNLSRKYGGSHKIHGFYAFVVFISMTFVLPIRELYGLRENACHASHPVLKLLR